MTVPGIPRPRFGEEWLIAVLDSLSEGVVALDRAGAVVAANPAAERALGFELTTGRYAHWRTLPWAALIDETGSPIEEEEHPIAVALASRQRQDPVVVGLPTSRATPRWLQLATHVLEGARGPAPDGVVVSFQDVTDRVSAEHARQRLLGLQREMMAAASHDLRTPLAVVITTAGLLREDWSDLEEEDRLEALQRIERQAGRLNRLVEDLALMSRLEEGGLVAEMRPVRVVELVEAALDGMTTDPSIEVTVDGSLMVDVDVDHGRRMLLNLVDNACKYGDPPVRIDAARVPDGVAITVTDAGPGVPPGFVDEMFDRFTRARPGIGPGMGLGLAIVDRLARLNEGSVSYESMPDGARFRLLLATPSTPG